ncbi:hypothetical protein VaNZ11_006385 [Volvox africanus]|uniref:Uncharacterized protein n=1 Tax=Volvox africanus TaxID=51714 RepID=A0ABQ5S0J8_9CHLO|nr:hypothetical protein VaNZ11_006385 [Volvox africanus]
MWQVLFALALTAGVAVALLAPNYMDNIKVDLTHTLGTACFFLGISSTAAKFRDLVGSPLGLGNISFSFFIGTFLWPALGLAATVLVLQAGWPFAVAVGFVLLAACPVGGPSCAVNLQTAGGSLECSLLMCLLSTPAALLTFPYIYRHFILMLLDQPLSPVESAAEARFRSQLSPDITSSALASLLHHVLFAAVLPLSAGAILVALLPPKLAASARCWGSAAAATMIVLTATVKTAEGADTVRAAGAKVAMAVVGLHTIALVLGYLIPAGVSAPDMTCRTTAYQASMRNSALGLCIAVALFGSSEHLALVVAPCVVSVFTQNLLGAWTALLGQLWAPRHPVSNSGQPVSPQAFKANSMDSILRQQTFRRLSERSSINAKED